MRRVLLVLVVLLLGGCSGSVSGYLEATSNVESEFSAAVKDYSQAYQKALSQGGDRFAEVCQTTRERLDALTTRLQNMHPPAAAAALHQARLAYLEAYRANLDPSLEYVTLVHDKSEPARVEALKKQLAEGYSQIDRTVTAAMKLRRELNPQAAQTP